MKLSKRFRKDARRNKREPFKVLSQSYRTTLDTNVPQLQPRRAS